MLDYQYSEAIDLHQWTFDFHNKNYSESAILRVTYEPKHSEVIQFDLELNGVNIDDGVGKDVTINWKFDDFEDGEQFWTDSNGLEMQRRIKDERFSFKLDKSGHQNVSWNYYPVNSAIAMRDVEKNGSKIDQGVQVTVMNERSQAGAATLQKGMIELIQNRRLLQDDQRGVEENLNETDADGFGMKVNAKYWLNIFDLKHSFSAQRPLQNSLDRPHSLFFAKAEKDDHPTTETIPPIESLNLIDSVSDWKMWQLFGRLVLFPLDKNMILVRVQNSADKFDNIAPEFTINMEKLAYETWISANPQSKGKVTPYIKEVSLGANMAETEVIARRESMKWRGQDDEIVRAKLEKDPQLKSIYEDTHSDDPLSAITLVPQAIRSFAIKFDASESAQFVF